MCDIQRKAWDSDEEEGGGPEQNSMLMRKFGDSENNNDEMKLRTCGFCNIQVGHCGRLDLCVLCTQPGFVV